MARGRGKYSERKEATMTVAEALSHAGHEFCHWTRGQSQSSEAGTSQFKPREPYSDVGLLI